SFAADSIVLRRDDALYVDIAATCIVLRPIASAPRTTRITGANSWTPVAIVRLPSTGGTSAPANSQKNNVGTAISSTASNRPTTIVAVIVPMSINAAVDRSRSISLAPRRRSPIDLSTNAINASARQAVARNPRSAMNATQSLLGHGLSVVPWSAASD